MNQKPLFIFSNPRSGSNFLSVNLFNQYNTYVFAHFTTKQYLSSRSAAHGYSLYSSIIIGQNIPLGEPAVFDKVHYNSRQKLKLVKTALKIIRTKHAHGCVTYRNTIATLLSMNSYWLRYNRKPNCALSRNTIQNYIQYRLFPQIYVLRTTANRTAFLNMHSYSDDTLKDLCKTWNYTSRNTRLFDDYEIRALKPDDIESLFAFLGSPSYLTNQFDLFRSQVGNDFYFKSEIPILSYDGLNPLARFSSKRMQVNLDDINSEYLDIILSGLSKYFNDSFLSKETSPNHVVNRSDLECSLKSNVYDGTLYYRLLGATS